MSRTSVTSTLRHLPLRPVALAAAAALLAGCSLIPAYQRPAAPVAPQWPATAGALPEGGTAAADLPWQDFVQDAQLRELISLALANNRDLRVAVQNIEAARAQYQIRRADQVPNFNATAGFSRSAPSALAAFGAPRVSQAYSVGVAMASWEIDFFGRVDALKEQALAQYLATEEARKSAQISLVANVASAWLTLKTDTELLALAERTLGTRQQTLQLTKLRFDNGASSALDLRQA
ncbi:MAG: TolC family protein, partial [Ottowia sp.]|nr:TolC family protein [Ottowia sp.]MCB2070385.1 TolC family protein [Ottowia sp.]